MQLARAKGRGGVKIYFVFKEYKSQEELDTYVKEQYSSDTGYQVDTLNYLVPGDGAYTSKEVANWCLTGG